MKRIGRPPIYTGNLERHIAKLVKEHNAMGARAILNANRGTKLAGQRNNKLVKAKGLGISLPTLNKIAAKYNVAHAIGRPANEVAVVITPTSGNVAVAA